MLKIENVKKGFPNLNGGTSLQVISDISLHIEKGNFISIMGPSGCGKSTLLRILAGLEEPDSGSVRVNGETLDAPGRGMVLISQKSDLLPWRTVTGNIEFGLELKGVEQSERRGRAKELTDLFGLGEFENYYPSQLSGGMARKVSFLRAMVTSPEVIFMDEPFVFLDREMSIELQEFLQSGWLKSKCTIVLVSHSIDEALFLAQRLVVFSPRPAEIKNEIKIDLPYPRDRYCDDFKNFRSEVEVIMKDKK